MAGLKAGARLRRWVAAPLDARSAFANPGVRRIELAWFLVGVGGSACMVGMLAYTYATGGTRLVAIYGLARTLPPAFVTPLLMSLVGRVSHETLLRWSVVGRAVLLTGTTVSLALGLAPGVAITLVAISASLSGAYRPLQADMLPWLVHTPRELVATNSSSTLMENAAALVGPALAGMVLLIADDRAVLGLSAGCLWAAVAAVTPVHLPDEAHSGAQDRTGHRSLVPGARAFLGILPAGGAAVLAALQTFTRGLLMVLVVVLAVEDLRLGRDSVGWLTAMIGLGGLLGGLVAVGTMRVTRLGRAFDGGVALWGIALLLLWAVPSPAVAYLAFLLVGVGNAVEDAGAFTLIPRIVGQQHSAGAFGTLELIAFAASALGAAAAPALAGRLGTVAALGVVGAAVLAGAVVWARSCLLLDRAARPPGPELDVVRAQAMFAALPVVTVERLVDGARTHHYSPGEPVMTEGEPGDSLHIIVTGTAAVTVRGAAHPGLGPGDVLGEIALLRDVPRTATVTATSPLVTVSLRREPFLSTVSGNRNTGRLASSMASARLAQDAAEG